MDVTFCFSKSFGPGGSLVLQSKQQQLDVLQLGAVLQHVRSPARGAHGKRGVTEENGVWEVLGEPDIRWEPWLPGWVWRIACPVFSAAPARGWFVLAACRLLRD